MKTVLLAAGLALFASPAFALYCAVPPSSGLVVQFYFGEKMSESELNEFYLKRLRARGVDATGVRHWGNCLRAFVRDEDGVGEHMEYYDPRTLERVQ